MFLGQTATTSNDPRESLRDVIRKVEEQQPFFDKALALEPKFAAMFGRDGNNIRKAILRAPSGEDRR